MVISLKEEFYSHADALIGIYNEVSCAVIYIIILYPDEQRQMRSNDTLGNTPFQLISDFFHVNKMLSVLSMLSKLPPGVCVLGGGGGGGGQQAR